MTNSQILLSISAKWCLNETTEWWRRRWWRRRNDLPSTSFFRDAELIKSTTKMKKTKSKLLSTGKGSLHWWSTERRPKTKNVYWCLYLLKKGVLWAWQKHIGLWWQGIWFKVINYLSLSLSHTHPHMHTPHAHAHTHADIHMDKHQPFQKKKKKQRCISTASKEMFVNTSINST